jgi:hypothetical protein
MKILVALLLLIDIVGATNVPSSFCPALLAP